MTVIAARKVFEPKGSKSEWEMLYDFLRPLEKGTIIKYDQLSSVMGRNILEARGPVYRAMQELERQDNRSLANVVGIGYRITIAQEHEGLAKHHHAKSKRQMKKALLKVTSADKSQLTREERARFEAMELAIKQQGDMIKRLDSRVAVVEKKQEKHDTTSAKLDKLMDALKRHGIEV